MFIYNFGFNYILQFFFLGNIQKYKIFPKKKSNQKNLI